MSSISPLGSPGLNVGSTVGTVSGAGENELSLHPSYAQALRYWEIVEAAYRGGPFLRANPSRYLSKRTNETDQEYADRAAQANYRDWYFRTLNNNKSKPFPTGEDTVTLTSDPWALSWVDDVTTDHRTLTEFSEDAIEKGLHYGVGHIVTLLPAHDGLPTLADYRNNRLWPYFRLIPAPALINWEHDDNGKLVWAHELIYNYTQEKGATMTLMVYRADGFRVLKVESRGNKKNVVQNEESAPLMPYSMDPMVQLDTPPISTFYTRRINPMIGVPPFQSLAESNLRHFDLWNALVDFELDGLQANLVRKGLTPEDSQAIDEQVRTQLLGADGQPMTTQQDVVRPRPTSTRQAIRFRPRRGWGRLLYRARPVGCGARA